MYSDGQIAAYTTMMLIGWEWRSIDASSVINNASEWDTIDDNSHMVGWMLWVRTRSTIVVTNVHMVFQLGGTAGDDVAAPDEGDAVRFTVAINSSTPSVGTVD